jgi:hypothetical protein
MYNQKKLFRSGFLFIFVLSLAGCGDNASIDEDITASMIAAGESESGSAEHAGKVQEIFYAVPSPMEMASMLKKAGAVYNVKMLNDVKNVHNYTTAKSKALNLGIYGADLSYASVFNQNQESIIYLSCAKKLADNLGVTKAFNDETIERMEANVDNRDSLLTIVSETYYLLDAYLKENGRDHVSALVITAGWVEGLYLSTAIASEEKNPSDELMIRIADQKLSLQNLIELVNAYNTNNQIDEIVADLTAIDQAFSGVTHTKAPAGAPVTEGGVTVIGGKTETVISKDDLIEITRVISEIRTRYIS